jgi:hypothetical protein
MACSICKRTGERVCSECPLAFDIPCADCEVFKWENQLTKGSAQDMTIGSTDTD